MRTWVWYLGTAVMATLCSVMAGGCLGYRVGPVFHGNYNSVAVPVFRNSTTQPQTGMEVQITNAIIKGLQAEGSLRVESVDTADVVVKGEIIRYQRTPLRSLKVQTGVPREYRYTITAQIEAYRGSTWRLRP